MSRKIHCSNCRADYPEEEMKKEILDYVQDPETGKPTATASRYAVFCGKCESYLGIADPSRDKTLNEFKKPTRASQPQVAPQTPQQPNA